MEANRGAPSIRGLRSEHIPDPTPEVGHCVHRIAMHPSRPGVLFMQKTLDVMRSDNAVRFVAGGQRQLPPISVFRLTSTRMSRKPFTSSRSRAIRSTIRRTASCASTGSRTGGNEWEALTKGLLNATAT